MFFSGQTGFPLSGKLLSDDHMLKNLHLRKQATNFDLMTVKKGRNDAIKSKAVIYAQSSHDFL